MLAKLINQLWLVFCLSMREEEMIQFSNEIESHPSILLGQLQGEQIRIFKYFRGLKSTYCFVSWVFLDFLRKLSQSLRKDKREYFCSVIFPNTSFRGIFHQSSEKHFTKAIFFVTIMPRKNSHCLLSSESGLVGAG